MTQKITARKLALGLCIILFCYCSCNFGKSSSFTHEDSLKIASDFIKKSSSFTHEDSLKIASDFIKKMSLTYAKTFGAPTFTKYYPVDSPVDEDKPIPNGIAKRMMEAYDSVPRLYNSRMEAVSSFYFNQKKWDFIKNIPGATDLIFRFGLKNYNETQGVIDSDVMPVYTLMVIPLDATKKPMMNNVMDYVCPCPGSPCCPR